MLIFVIIMSKTMKDLKKNTCKDVFLFVGVRVCVCACMCVYPCVCLCVCVYAHVCMDAGTFEN